MGSLFDAIAAVPSLLQLCKWVAEEIRAAEVRANEAKMTQAIQDTQVSKDTSAIDKLFDPDKK